MSDRFKAVRVLREKAIPHKKFCGGLAEVPGLVMLPPGGETCVDGKIPEDALVFGEPGSCDTTTPEDEPLLTTTVRNDEEGIIPSKTSSSPANNLLFNPKEDLVLLLPWG